MLKGPGETGAKHRYVCAGQPACLADAQRPTACFGPGDTDRNKESNGVGMSHLGGNLRGSV